MDEGRWDTYAERYHQEIVSPFFPGVKNPLLAELKNVEQSREKKVAEFGCGHFEMGPLLAQSFKEVYASDFSTKMVEIAKTRHGHFPNVSIIKEDMSRLSHKNSFDLVISVNSLIMPSERMVRNALAGFYDALKSGGDLFLIVPSMEGVLYHGLLLFEKEMSQKNESVAKRVSKIKFEKKKYDLFFGYYKDGRDVQKFYYHHEIQFLLRKAGFTNITIEKVLYPWGEDVSGYENFYGEEPMWDWFVKAKK
ncbi:MAG TPA: class I SAM-dependent methyltransferase [Candidatus Nanoarchaeia archaeon]|nr:class I SAM-dependent methyltransferase [Candidatus Nanoarchaeia archaeon]